MFKILKSNSGIIYLGTVILVLIVFGMIAYTLANLSVIGNGKTANLYADTQAELAALAGIEHAFNNIIIDFSNYWGTTDTISMGKSKFFIEVDTFDEYGVKLRSDRKRVIATGMTGSSQKKVQVIFSALQEAAEFAMYIFGLEDPVKKTYVYFGNNNKLDGFIWFGTNVDVRLTRANIGTVGIYVPQGHSVTTDAPFDETYKWQIYPPPLPEFPVFDTSVHDSLLTVARSIAVTDTVGNGNKFFGDFLIGDAFDISEYLDNTLFINGDLLVTGAGAIIASGTLENPGFIVVNGTAEFKNGCSVGDNITTVASGDVSVVSTGTRYGLDWSHLPWGDRPTRVNELFSYTNVSISGGIVYANVESLGDLSLRGTIYAVCYCVGTVEIESATFQGSVVANSVKLDRITNSVMEFVPPLPGTATSGLKPTIRSGSWKML